MGDWRLAPLVGLQVLVWRLRDERGQTITEYALIIAGVALAALAATKAFEWVLQQFFGRMADSIED